MVFKNFNFIKAIFITIVYFFLSIAISFLGILSEFIDYEKNFKMWEWSLTLFPSFGNLIVLILVLFFMARSNNDEISNKKSLSIINVLFSILLGVLIVYIQTPLNYLYQYLPGCGDFNGFNTDIEEFKFIYLPSLISSILIIPLIEEVVFRKIIFGQLIKNYNFAFALISSSLLFASVHLPDYSQFYTTIIGGILSSLLFYKTNRLTLCVIFHMTWNAIVALSSFWTIFNI